MASCIDSTCSSADIAAARAYSQSVCNSVGVSLVNSATITGAAATLHSTISGTQSSGASPTGSNTGGNTSTSSSHSPPIGAIVGGAVGGVVVLAAMAIALFIYIRKTRNTVQVNPEPEVKPFDPNRGLGAQSEMQSQSTLPYTSSAFNTADPTPYDSFIQPSSSSRYLVAPSSSDRTSTTTSGTIAGTRQLVSDIPTIHTIASRVSYGPSTETGTIAQSPHAVSRTSSPSATLSNGPLAVEQLVTLRTLYNLNMPAAEIAGVMDRMRNEQQVSDQGSRIGFACGDATDAMRDPPSYDTPAAEIADNMEGAGPKEQPSGEGSSGLARGDIRPDPPMYDFKDK